MFSKDESFSEIRYYGQELIEMANWVQKFLYAFQRTLAKCLQGANIQAMLGCFVEDIGLYNSTPLHSWVY